MRFSINGINRSLLAVACILQWQAGLLGPACAGADNWPQWRGPGAQGVAPAGDYPTSWSADTNVLWRLPLPGVGASTPAIWGERILLTYSANQRNVVAALDMDGKHVWSVDVGDEHQGKHKKGTGSNPSPTTDGETVFAYFKSGDLVAVDFQGRVLWQKNLQDQYGEDTLWWDLGTSPVLAGDLVIVAVMQSGPSYLVAYDKKTGQTVWKQDRMLEAPEESAQSYSTPIIVQGADGQSQLVVLGADHVTAHEVATGKETWRVGGLNPGGDRFFRSIASPVLSKDLVIAPYARGNTLTAIRLGGSGDVTASHVVWSRQDVSADVPTPAARDGRIYCCRDRNSVVCLDAETGETIWNTTLNRNVNNYSASPILAGDKLYLTREDGTVFVLRAEDGEVIAENPLDEFTVATPVFHNNRVYLRTRETLYCFGK